MKTATLYRLLLAVTFTGILASCNKSNSNSTNSNESSNTGLQTNSDDETRVSTETDAAFDDVNTAMTVNYNVTGAAYGRQVMHTVVDGPGSADSTAICDAVITLDTANGTRQITITYNGTNCALDRTRTGSVTITWPIGQQWQTAGAVVTVQFNSLAITRLSDNKTITLNGTHTYTNVSGGSLITLPNAPAGTSITHTITSDNMQITFDNGAKRNWNVARQRVFTYSGGYVITTSGTHTQGTTSGISEWGTDRFGLAFTVAIVQPRVITQGCSWQMTAGEVALSNSIGTTTITYGLNSTGTSTSCPVAGATYYFQLAWTAASSGKTYSIILPY